MITHLAEVKNDLNKGEYLDSRELDTLSNIIKSGGLVAFPTETVYGLGANALDSEAANKIYKAKGRPSDNPLIAHIAEVDAMNKIAVDIPDKAYDLAKAFWPGPLTMILKKSREVPYATTGGLDTVAIRMPNNKIALSLIEASGVPIAAPSANISGKPSPTKAAHVIDDLSGRVDAIVCAGDCDVGIESTIIDLSVDLSLGNPVILRPGFITQRDIENVIGSVDVSGSSADDDSPKAPGMKYRHYSPKAPVYIVRGEDDKVISYIQGRITLGVDANKRIAVITSNTHSEYYRDAHVLSLGNLNNDDEIAKNLFASLRKCDDIGADEIYSEFFGEEGIMLAVYNRLSKAAGGNIINLE